MKFKLVKSFLLLISILAALSLQFACSPNKALEDEIGANFGDGTVNKPGQQPGGFVSGNTIDLSLATFDHLQEVNRKFTLALTAENAEKCLKPGPLMELGSSVATEIRFRMEVAWNKCPMNLSTQKGTLSGTEVFEIRVLRKEKSEEPATQPSEESDGVQQKATPRTESEPEQVPYSAEDVSTISVSTENMILRLKDGPEPRLPVSWDFLMQRRRDGYEFTYRFNPEEWTELENKNRKVYHAHSLEMSGRYMRDEEGFKLPELHTHMSLERFERRGMGRTKSDVTEFDLESQGTLALTNCGKPVGVIRMTWRTPNGQTHYGKLNSDGQIMKDSLSATTHNWVCGRRSDKKTQKAAPESRRREDRVLQ